MDSVKTNFNIHFLVPTLRFFICGFLIIQPEGWVLVFLFNKKSLGPLDNAFALRPPEVSSEKEKGKSLFPFMDAGNQKNWGKENGC